METSNIKEGVYVLHDLKANGYTTPVVCINDGVACRVFGRLVVQEPHSIVALYPQDYDVIRIGEYDGQNGSIEPSKHQIVCNMKVIKDKLGGA